MWNLAAVPGRANLESTFLEHLASIEKICAFISRKHGLEAHDADDFASQVKLRLVENEYAILRKFRGESSLPTFLAVVIAALFRDYRVEKWGRWRPSVVARSYGPAAVRLETLLYRDGYPMLEACMLLQTSEQFAMSEQEARALVLKLPRRGQLRPIELSGETLSSEAVGEFAHSPPDDPVALEERARIEGALDEAMHELSSEDRLLLRMRFWESLRVADIARILGLQQKQLYRRLDRVVESVGAALRLRGIADDDVRELLGGSIE